MNKCKTLLNGAKFPPRWQKDQSNERTKWTQSKLTAGVQKRREQNFSSATKIAGGDFFSNQTENKKNSEIFYKTLRAKSDKIEAKPSKFY